MSNFKVEINQAYDASDPLEMDEGIVSQFFCLHRSYRLGHFQPATPEECMEMIKEQGTKLFLLPLYMYDHGSITISLQPFNCRWDSGQLGWVLVTKERVKKIMGWKRITSKRKERVMKFIESEVKMYDDYLRGDVYYYEVYKDEELHNSCWGYIGDHDSSGLKEDCIDFLRSEGLSEEDAEELFDQAL